MARFKDRTLEKSYLYALDNHTTLYREQGNSGATHREAYSRGYRSERSLYSLNSLCHAYYAAGKKNAKKATQRSYRDERKTQ
jgi:hypothetical protein